MGLFTCPYCGFNVADIQRKIHLYDVGQAGFYRCPNPNCLKVFVGYARTWWKLENWNRFQKKPSGQLSLRDFLNYPSSG